MRGARGRAGREMQPWRLEVVMYTFNGLKSGKLWAVFR